MELLRVISEYGSLHAAERDGRMTQPTASRRLSSLERRLRTGLVLRTSTGTRLTEPGHALLNVGRRLLHEIDFAVATAHCGAECGARPVVLRFAVCPEWARGMADEPVPWLPEVVLDLVPTCADDLWQRFDRYAVDAACGWQPTAEIPARRADVQVHTLVEEPRWVALPGGHPLSRLAVLDVRQLADCTWIATRPEPLARLAPGLRPGYRVHSEGAALELVGRGHGVAFVSPLSTLPVPEGSVVLRPLLQRVTERLVLAVHPLVLPAAVTHDLGDWLRFRYAETAARRNRAYLDSRDFPVAASDLHRPLPRTACPPGGPLPAPVPSGHGNAAGFEAAHLHLLRVIEQTGSLSRAAFALLVTQPALTRRIHRLEKLCGLALVRSEPRGTSLTVAARRLLLCTEVAESRLDALVLRLRESGGTAPRRTFPRSRTNMLS
ncbi:LysR family transcriptional regulator [Streptomyces sp. NPDC057877]|uniref:LysR family transcriptional regulator n=1 Tax=Streptomyces sp. NPDC057877 TaxID=3346269 RepID=UPI0036B53BC8